MSQQSNIVQTEAGLMYLDPQDSLKLGEYGYYEPEETALIKQLLKPTDTALDIGAHIGYFTLLMAQRCKKVYAIEPDLTNVNIIAKNLRLNNITNVDEIPYAVGEKQGLVNFYKCKDNSGMHRIYKSKWWNRSTEKVGCLIIDWHIHEANFIKMDIEGSELGALKGMKNLLTKSKPTILMEFCPQYIEEYGANPEEEYHFLKTLGYSIRLLPDKDTPISYEDLERETRKEPTGRNILAV